MIKKFYLATLLLLMVGLVPNMFAQQRITGKITDLDYQTETVAVGGRNVINVTLLEGNLVQNDGY